MNIVFGEMMQRVANRAISFLWSWAEKFGHLNNHSIAGYSNKLNILLSDARATGSISPSDWEFFHIFDVGEEIQEPKFDELCFIQEDRGIIIGIYKGCSLGIYQIRTRHAGTVIINSERWKKSVKYSVIYPETYAWFKEDDKTKDVIKLTPRNNEEILRF